EATAALSPEGWSVEHTPQHVETWQVPDPYRGRHLDGAQMEAAIGRLVDGGLAPAAAMFDGLVTSDGIQNLSRDHVQDLVAQVRAAGGLWIADEVQAGHGRTGESLWSFQRHGVVPDFVTLGKPMGNGHPVAAVITRRELLDQIPGRSVFFSTY